MSFEEKLLRFKNMVRVTRLRRQVYEAIEKMEQGKRQLELAEKEILEMCRE